MSDVETIEPESEPLSNAEVNADEVPVPEVVSPSKKKRKLDSPAKITREDDDNDDGSVCSICLDNFNSSGPHRLISLRCGHIYGEICITKWLKDQKICPQCKSKASPRDFRSIFATKIQCIDNSHEMELELKIRKLENEKLNLVMVNESNITTIALQKRQIKRLEEELERYKTMKLTRSNTGAECIQTIKGGRMYLEKNIDFKDNSDCRMVKFMLKSKKLIVTQKAVGTALFTGYGLRFIDAGTYRGEKFINVTNRPVMDVSFDPTESFISTASREPACKIYNVNTCQSIATIALQNIPIWCCSFNKDRDNQVVLGGQNGLIYTYDLKRSSEATSSVTSLENRTPVKFIISINRSESFPHGGFFVIHVRGNYIYECLASLDFKVTKLNFEDSILSASYDSKTEMLLVSTPAQDQTTHILMRLIRADAVPVLQEIYRVTNNCVSTSRPVQIKVPDGFIVASYASSTREIQAHTPSIGKFHSILMQSPVNDFCPIYTEGMGTPAFAALSSTKCRIYKVNLDYA